MRPLPLLLIAAIACKGKEDAEPPVPPGETGAEATGDSMAASPRIYRLTHDQWDRMTADLLRLDAPSGLSASFIGDTLHDGFANNGDAMLVSPELFRDYQRAAETLGAQVVADPDLYARVVPQDPREGGVAFDTTVEVESDPSVTHEVGDVSGPGWMLWSDGSLYVPVTLPTRTSYRITARMSSSDCADGVFGDAELSVDGISLGTFTTTATYADYSGEIELGSGPHTVAVTFLNDCWIEGVADRNLIVDWVRIEGAEGALGASTSGEPQARAWIQDFGGRAYRRPLTSAEVDGWYTLFAAAPALTGSGDDFADGVRFVVTGMLQSPHTLYRIEASETPDATGRIPLDDYEVASKLSFALWGTMPDDALFAVAAAGGLSTAEDVGRVAREMLEDPRADVAIDDFHAQLLQLDLTANIFKDEDDFPQFTSEYPGFMRQEAERFVDAVVWEDRGGLSELLGAEFTVVNRSLAAVYGVPGPATDDAWARATLPSGERSGILTQSWFLATHADSTTPSIIHRGVFINENVLCVGIPAPPPDVTPLPAPSTGETNRERVEAHTGEGTCGEVCHATIINPPGYALEHYDALGQWRATDNGQPVDAASSYALSDGERSWVDGVAFAKLIAGHADAHACYSTKWLSYLLGRTSAEEDDALLAPVAAASLGGSSVLDVVTSVVQSDAFRYRVDEVAP